MKTFMERYQVIFHRDRQIIDNLQQYGAQKRKGEEELFDPYLLYTAGHAKAFFNKGGIIRCLLDTILSAIEKIASVVHLKGFPH